MSWGYRQSTGQLTDPAGKHITFGYSGHAAGVNNPAMQAVPFVGPIPAGEYRIGPAYRHPKLGRCVMNLEPVGHDAEGRLYFRLHGDNSRMNRTGSEGCIVAPFHARAAMDASPNRTLIVVP